MAHGSDSQLDSQPESRVSNPGDAAMANTAAQSYSGGEFQSMSQGAYAQSAKDSQDMSKGPNATLGDLQITDANSGKGSDAGIPPSAEHSRASDAGMAHRANPSLDTESSRTPGADLGKDANSGTKTEANSVSDAAVAAPPTANSASDANSGLPTIANSASDAGAGAPPTASSVSDANSGLPPSTSGNNSLAHSSGEKNLHPGSANASSNGDAFTHSSHINPGSGDAALHSSHASAGNGDATLHGSSAGPDNINAARSNDAALQNFDPKGDVSLNNQPELSRTTDHPGAATGYISTHSSTEAGSANVNPNRERNFESWNGGQAGSYTGSIDQANTTPRAAGDARNAAGDSANLPSDSKASDINTADSNQTTSYPLRDGGSLSLQDNNKAQLTDASGKTQDYNYYSNNDNGWHTMYKDSQNPREIADSMKQFRITPESGNGGQSLDLSEPTYSAMHSSKLSQADRDFVDQNVPPGSKPLGIGINRQAWQTPDNKAVVIGPNDYRSDAPFLLPPEKTVVSGDKKAETFPLGESNSISKDDVDKFVKDWADKGWEMRDNKISNFARTSDGKMWRVDPDEILNWNEFKPNKRPKW